MSFRVLTGLFGHESNAFSKLPTGIENFRDYLLVVGDAIPAAVAGSAIEPAGVEEAAAELGWELVRTIAAWATPSGPVTREAWDVCSGEILETAASKGPFDGVLINLHGAMATEDYPDAEGELLARLRDAIGPDVPIAITLDLHANVTERMVANADIVTAYRTYPHIDQKATSHRAAHLLDRAMKGEVRPRPVLARRPQIEGLDDGRTTTDNPMTELLARAEAHEAAGDALLISVQAGFTPADLEEAGPSVVVIADASAVEPGRAIAEAFMDYAWETRHFDSNTYLSVAETVAELKRLGTDDGPVVVADFSDNPGSGAYGDSTLLLQELIESGLPDVAFGTICDPEAAAQLVAAGEGTEATVSLGGKVDPAFGAPLTLTGTVVTVTDGAFVAQGPRWKGVTLRLGPTAVFRVGAVDIVVCSKRVQVTELETFTHAGIDPRKRAVVAVKSMQHFRAAFQPIARTVLICDAGALATKDCAKLPFTRLRRPIYPLDLD